MSTGQAIRPGSARRIASAALALVWTTAAPAQVIEVGDDGGLIVHRGPAVITDAGEKPLTSLSPAAAVMPAARLAVARGTGAPVVPVGEGAALFRSAAADVGIDYRLLHAVAWQESRFRQSAVSPRGAIGVMQLMPTTARRIGIDPTNVGQNVRGGAWLLSSLLRQYGGDVRLALAAYNAGPGAVHRHGGVPPYAETRDYVSTIMRRLDASISATAVHLEKAL